MADKDIQNAHSEEINRYEHRRKNVGAKAVVLYGYDADTDSYYPVSLFDNGDGTFSINARVSLGIFDDVDYDEFVGTSEDANGNPTVATLKKDGVTVATATVEHNSNDKLIHITRTS